MKMNRIIRVLPENILVTTADESILLGVLREHNLAPEAPCGGHGTCGKCKVLVGSWRARRSLTAT